MNTMRAKDFLPNTSATAIKATDNDSLGRMYNIFEASLSNHGEDATERTALNTIDNEMTARGMWVYGGQTG